jgi:tetratricopeptide (TPR) repeat protein
MVSPELKLYLQRIVLILFGLFIALVVLEVAFRIGGYIYLQLQENKNLVSLEKKGAYRIMCLGESTTADFHEEISYPRQLESILNKKKLGVQFTVINKGVPAIQTTQIVERLKNNLDKYDPDIVVTMIGMNDSFSYLNLPKGDGVLKPVQRFFLSKSRIYKLYKLLIAHIISKFKEKRILGEKQYARVVEIDPSNDKAHCRLGRVYMEKANFKRAKAMFRKAVEINNRNASAYSGLARCYRHESDYEKAKEMYKKSIQINPKGEWAYYGLAVCYQLEDKDYDKARKMLEKVLELNPGNGWACLRLGDIYKKIGEYEKIEDFYKRAIELNPQFDRLYGALAKFYKEQGSSSLASKYSDKMIRSTSIYYEPRVRKNYRKLKNILFERGVKLVCVQYPMRSVYPLKEVFESKKNIVFVDNEKSFKIKVAKHGYNKYFIDSFGGNFGHCTTVGNRLLAENVAKAIVNNYFNK